MIYKNSQIAVAIEEYIHSKRDREILLRKWIDGDSFKTLADDFQLSETTIKRIVKKGREKLLKETE